MPNILGKSCYGNLTSTGKNTSHPLEPHLSVPPLSTCVSLESQTASSFCLALELPEDWENAAGEPLNERFHASIITLFSQSLHKIAK